MASATNGILISRTINAPRQRVWDAFTIQEHIDKWYTPAGYSNTIFEMDVRVGGRWRYVMRDSKVSPKGTSEEYVNWMRYTQLQAPSFMAYEHGGDDETKADLDVTIRLSEQGNQTLVDYCMLLETPEVRDLLIEGGAIVGGEQMLARLAQYLEGEAS